MGVVAGVPRNAKTKAANSGRFELDPSSSRPTSSAAFSFFSQVYITCSHLPSSLVRSVTGPAVTVPRKP